MKRTVALFYIWGCLTAAAQTVLPTIRVSSETVPAGGLAQMKVLLTSPKPIVSGNMYLDMSSVSFDSIDGIALFSNTGDVAGAAVVDGSQVNVQFTSPHGTFGTNADYPLLTIALTVSRNALTLQKFPVILSPGASLWQSLLGSAVAFEFQQGSITVGGGVNITNVLPGGGNIAAGGSFSIMGHNFSPHTKVSLRNMTASAIQYISPTEIRVTVRSAGLLDGTLIQVLNPDNSTDSYFSYLRGVPVGKSTRPLLARTVPVFSIQTATEAILPPTISSQVNAAYFTAMALQNPSSVTANILVESYSSSGALTGSMNLSLPSGGRISREVSELLGAPLPPGSYLRMVSDQPVQMVGLLGNDQTAVVLPVGVRVVSGPPPPPVTPPGAGGGGTGGGHTGGGL